MLFGGIIRFYQRLYDEVEWRRDEIDFHMISEEDRTWSERPFRKVVAATICSCSRTTSTRTRWFLNSPRLLQAPLVCSP